MMESNVIKGNSRGDKMKRIGIITIYDVIPNYGNKLQNYAAKAVLERFNYSVDTIITEPQKQISGIRLKLLLNSLSMYKLRGRIAQLTWKKEVVFNNFNKRYLNPCNTATNGMVDSQQYDFFSLGSDQVWNPEWYSTYPYKKDLFLLTFAKPEQMICMAPSFGVEELPTEWRAWFQEQLQRFPKIAVREEAGVHIVKELTGKNAEVIIDPTMMLSKNEWLQIAKKPKGLQSDNNILTYFIGGRSNSVDNQINKIAKENGLEVYNLLDFAQPEIFVSGPSEFVYLIANADLVMTDSFHACVFSILFEKPFMVFNRKGTNGSMNSRIDTLLKKFDLERKAEWAGLDNDLFEAEYSETYSLLELERKKALDFLRCSLGIEE